MKSQVKIRLDIEGFHKWENAPDKVNFLRERHRHIFNVTGYIDVKGLDREIEIFMFEWEVKDYIEKVYGKPAEFGGMSCEMICLELVEKFGFSEVEVLEDGMGGGRVCQ